MKRYLLFKHNLIKLNWVARVSQIQTFLTRLLWTPNYLQKFSFHVFRAMSPKKCHLNKNLQGTFFLIYHQLSEYWIKLINYKWFFLFSLRLLIEYNVSIRRKWVFKYYVGLSCWRSLKTQFPLRNNLQFFKNCCQKTTVKFICGWIINKSYVDLTCNRN